MIVRISQSSLSDLLRAASKFVPSRTPMAALKGVYLEAQTASDSAGVLIVLATDLKQGVRVWTDRVTTTEEGSCVVDAETFTGFVSALDGLAVIDLKIEKGKLVASARSAKASFALLSVDDFPVTSGPTKMAECFTINGHRLASLVQGASRFTS